MITETITLNFQAIHLTNDQFYQLCQINTDWQLEHTAQGELIIMPPVGAISGNRESEFNGLIWLWNRRTKLGKVFSSSTIFCLPNGGKRSPDVAWIRNERWDTLTLDEQEKFPPLCPDFVIELRSRTDKLDQLRTKMQEYLSSGLQLGWLIDPQGQQVELYRRDRPVEIHPLPVTLSGADILPDLEIVIERF
ncbi:Uma2 family endonuclease [Spirulina major CS-329]|uniref:Uma2 family endonuclease n=1 Tax=Spirulina TaxID=1154 RepID=UPI00232EA8F2|nr:Uma2 family endonuclease [Spirulina major]MDB9504584.1 Uma2 family endonuclease [Spirulina major CS-329]